MRENARFDVVDREQQRLFGDLMHEHVRHDVVDSGLGAERMAFCRHPFLPIRSRLSCLLPEVRK